VDGPAKLCQANRNDSPAALTPGSSDRKVEGHDATH
jgi:hypothetical protein